MQTCIRTVILICTFLNVLVNRKRSYHSIFKLGKHILLIIKKHEESVTIFLQLLFYMKKTTLSNKIIRYIGTGHIIAQYYNKFHDFLSHLHPMGHWALTGVVTWK